MKLSGHYELEIVPSFTLSQGYPVEIKGEGGEYEIFRRDGKAVPASELLKAISEEYESVHVIDLEGLIKGDNQISFLREAVEHIDVWYDGGIAASSEIYDPLMLGVRKVVVATKSICSMDTVLDCYELTPNVIFELDYHNGIISPGEGIVNRDLNTVLSDVRSLGIGEIIVADFGRIEEGGDLDELLLEKVMKSGLRTYAAGDITPGDLPLLERLGVDGALMKLDSVIE